VLSFTIGVQIILIKEFYVGFHFCKFPKYSVFIAAHFYTDVKKHMCEYTLQFLCILCCIRDYVKNSVVFWPHAGLWDIKPCGT
jgi:hypothetical protein